MSHFLKGLETTNTDLASALLAVGIPLDAKMPMRKITGDCGDRVTFFFMPVSPCGLYHTAELMLAWDDLTWHERNPEHPFAYLKVAVSNRKRILDYIHRKVPCGVVRKGSKLLFIPLDASDELQRKCFKELNR